MNFPVVSIETAAVELDRLHGEIETSLRMTVEYAIRAGEILSNVKEKIGHGEFLPWLNSSVSFSERTAQNYMRVYHHSDKTASVADLQEAYRVVERIETQERQTENQKAMQRVREFNKTGKKPEGWRRGTDDKIAQEEADRDDRLEAVKSKMAEAEKVKAETRQQREADDETWEHSSAVLESVSKAISEKLEQRARFKERIRVSQSGESDQFIEALMDYLDELENDNRRIEACQNIIKVCRNIAAELQVQ